MPLTYSRIHVYYIDTLADGEQRIALAFSKGSRQYAFLAERLRVSLERGYGFPSFEDGGSLIFLMPSLSMQMASWKPL